MKIHYDIPDGSNGEWVLESFSVNNDNNTYENIRHYKTGRYVPNGTYKRLLRNRDVIMSNTPDEIGDFISFVNKAKGKILISGLGMGLLVKTLLEKPEVENITVIEISPELIELISPYFNDTRLEIINADIFMWKPNREQKWDYAWHDIWDSICSDNLKDIKILHRKFKKFVNYQESWCRDACETQLKNDKKYGWV